MAHYALRNMFARDTLFIARLGRLAWVAAGIFLISAASAQTLPNIRVTFGPSNSRILPPDPCFEFACFNRASYDKDTLAAIGVTLENPNVYVYLRLAAGPWYAQAVLKNKSAVPAGARAGYRHPLLVVGDDIWVTAFQDTADGTYSCEGTHIFGRTGTRWDTRWAVKQVIPICASGYARDGDRVLLGGGTQMPVYVRGADGLYTVENRIPMPQGQPFNGPVAMHAWTAVVGAPSANSGTGAAFVFQRRANQWVFTKTLVPEGAGSQANFGSAVSVHEYNIAVGAPGAVNPSGVGTGLVYMYTGVGENWSLSQEIAEPPGTDNLFGSALALQGRRLIVSSDNHYPYAQGPFGYLFERRRLESTWVARATMAGHGLGIEISGNTVMVDSEGLRAGTFPLIVNLPPVQEPDPR